MEDRRGVTRRIIVHAIPTFIRDGIPLIAPRQRLVPPRLRSVKRFADGVVRLHYDVTKGNAPASSRRFQNA